MEYESKYILDNDEGKFIEKPKENKTILAQIIEKKEDDFTPSIIENYPERILPEVDNNAKSPELMKENSITFDNDKDAYEKILPPLDLLLKKPELKDEKYRIDEDKFTYKKKKTEKPPVTPVKITEKKSTPIPTPTPYHDWMISTEYTLGFIVMYNGSKWECIVAHTSLSGWDPVSTSGTLWKKL